MRKGCEIGRLVRICGTTATDRPGSERGPAPRTFHRGLPPGVGRLVARSWLEAAVQPPRVGQLVPVLPHPGAEPGEERRTQRGGLQHLRAPHRDGELVGLDLTEQVVRTGTAVDSENGQGQTRLVSHRRDDVADLEGDRLQGRPDEMGAGAAAGQADDQPAGVGVPVRGAQSGECGYEHDTAAVRRRSPPISSVCAASSISPRPSRSHCTAAPVTNTAPSRA